MEKELQEEFRAQFGKELRKGAFKEFANAAFDKNKIGEVEKLFEGKTKELEAFRKELSEIEADPESHKRSLREKAKELRGQIEKAEQFIKDCNTTKSTIMQTVEAQRQKGAQYLERAKFADTFIFEE